MLSKDNCDTVRSDGHALDVTSQIGTAAVVDTNKQNTCRDSSGSSANTLRTYKRRRTTTSHDEKVSPCLEAQMKEKLDDEISHAAVNKSSVESDNVAGSGVCNSNIVFDTALIKHWRNFFLQQMFVSLEGENGLKGCIRDALDFHSENACSSAVKESVHSCEDLRKRAAGPQQNAASGLGDAAFAVPENVAKEPTVTELCQRAFFDVVTSEKFALLCRVLGNFESAKVHSYFNIAGIDSKIKEGAYESSPVLFLSDIEQLWMKLQDTGLEIVTLTKSLIKKSRTAYREQVGGVLPEVSDDVNLEFVTEESGMHTKVEQTQGYSTYKSRSCICCKERADVRDSLVCDSCEEMYHVSCIKPAVREIPSRSWYCASCTARGMEPPHDQCVVCERLTASRLLANISGVDQLFNNDELEESSNNQVESDVKLSKGKVKVCCNVCRTDVQNGEDLKVCGHTFCPHKYYHARCLSEEKLTCHGPVWYCPSCLCRVCLIDCDDDKIVMCDACDEAYHIYCMHPPRTLIPRGKWFCIKCDSEIRLIRKAKRTYEKTQSKLEGKEASDVGPTGSVTGKAKEEEEPLESSGAMDMLLKAATSLNNEENWSITAMKH